MPRSTRTFFKPGILSTAVAAALIAGTDLAQAQLEEVIVTASRRAESMQDVAISMLSKSGEEIKDMGITRAAEFAVDIPAVTMSQSPIGNFIFIRGIGTAGVNQGIELSVSMFHDGVYMGRHQLSRAPFMDLERVEVLRGPQSILFGKNTIGGAIHLITAKPTEEVEGSISALYGTYGEQEISGVLSGPITDTLSGRIALRGYQMDGYLDNIMTGEDGPERDDKTARLQLKWDATENLTINGKWETSEFEQTQQFTQLSVSDPTGTGIAFGGLNSALVAVGSGTGIGSERFDDERAVDNDGGVVLGQVAPDYAGLPGFPDKPEFSNNSMDLGTITMDWAIGDHTITSITGYASYDYQDICDCDFAAIPLIQVDATEDYEQMSQEIRFTSPGGERFDYIVGMYYQESELDYRSVEGFGTSLASPLLGAPAALTPNLTRDYSMQQDQEMWAVFGSGTYSFTDTTRLTAGLRYFDESKTASHVLDKNFTGGWDYSAAAGLAPGSITYGDTAAEYDRFLGDFAGTALTAISEGIYGGLLGTFEHDIQDRKRDEQDINWILTLEQDLGDNTMVFGTVSTGTKGGGFDGRFLQTNDSPFFEYEEETAISYELGVKTTLLDGMMSLNATAFFSTVEDYQVSIFDGATAFFVQNAAEVETSGLEVDVKWAPTDGLIVSFAGTYLNAEYSDFPNAPCWSVSGTEPVDRGNCVNRGAPDASRDATGDTNMFSPEFAFNLNIDYRMPLGNALEARGTFNMNYSDEFFAASDLDPIYAGQDAYTMYDLRLSLGRQDGMWDVALIGKNLTDELISGNSNDQPLVPGNGFASTDRLRSYALQATYRF
ncbi:TonB-dependent receptor [Congregibacter variabilis]|uniref:TonB-dependent receptor n=1 Tax=Congregibacter variabilis TaxID=3081200 RepID=A0ABZ0I013_9GAMM|nr:TonB-dependent receptor [Congregibacter sp. IMCC43200]